MTAQPLPVRLTPNLLGIPFAFAGLAQCWAAAHAGSAAPSWPADVLWTVSGVLWLVVSVAYVWNVVRTGRSRTELLDPTFAPFIALLFIIPMLLGVAWSDAHPTSGKAIFFAALLLAVLFGGWLSGQWIVSDLRLAQWHPGYFLPTVAGGFIGAAGCAALGHESLARFMFGYGMICWFALGSIILARLFIEAPLPPGLTPTLAIEVAPAVVAGNAWFRINGAHIDTVVLFLAGYALLMVLVQVRLAPVFARLAFAPGWWSFGFSYAAAATFALRWMTIADVEHQRLFAGCLLSVITLAIGALTMRTVVALKRGAFLPRASAPAAPAA